MLGSLAGVVDRRLTDVIAARARRRWPLLTWLPDRWLQPLVSPVAVRLRRSLLRGVVVALAATAAAVVLGAVLF